MRRKWQERLLPLMVADMAGRERGVLDFAGPSRWWAGDASLYLNDWLCRVV
jgi:hypothetical protein